MHPVSSQPQQQIQVYSLGNLPRTTYSEYRTCTEEYKPKGKRQPLETIDNTKLIDKVKVLNLAAYDPQLQESVIDIQKYKVIQHYVQKDFDHTVEEMYIYLETFLRETAKVAWKKYKEKFPQEIANDIALGRNPHNLQIGYNIY